MYICRECGQVFSEPERFNDPVGYYFGETAYEEWDVCPECGETSIEEAVKCHCGEYTLITEPLCRECKEDIEKGFESLVGNLTDDGIDYLFELMEGLE